MYKQIYIFFKSQKAGSLGSSWGLSLAIFDSVTTVVSPTGAMLALAFVNSRPGTKKLRTAKWS